MEAESASAREKILNEQLSLSSEMGLQLKIQADQFGDRENKLLQEIKLALEKEKNIEGQLYDASEKEKQLNKRLIEAVAKDSQIMDDAKKIENELNQRVLIQNEQISQLQAKLFKKGQVYNFHNKTSSVVTITSED